MGPLEEKVDRMLYMPITREPDKAVSPKQLIKRLVILYNYRIDHSYFYDGYKCGVSVAIEVLPWGILRAYYGGYGGANARSNVLKEFLNSNKMQMAYIAYKAHNNNGLPKTILQMIAPLEERQVFVRGIKKEEGLVPHRLDKRVVDYLPQISSCSLNI